jgi:hypothetical protein
MINRETAGRVPLPTNLEANPNRVTKPEVFHSSSLEKKNTSVSVHLFFFCWRNENVYYKHGQQRSINNYIYQAIMVNW